MSAGRSTINTTLKVGATVGALTQVSKIKSYPQLFGEPSLLETTDLEDTMTTHVFGVQDVPMMNFTLNHDMDVFEDYKAMEGTEQYFELAFGASGVDGIFSWKGNVAIYINEGSVNGVREMTLAVSPSTEIYPEAAATAFAS